MSSSCDLERARRPPTPSRYGAGGMAKDEGMLPPGLALESENDDDIVDDAAPSVAGKPKGAGKRKSPI